MVRAESSLDSRFTMDFGGFNETKKRGLQLIVVDPRVTEVATRADIHLQFKPGTDAALFAGLLRVIIDLGLDNAEFNARWSDGSVLYRTEP